MQSNILLFTLPILLFAANLENTSIQKTNPASTMQILSNSLLTKRPQERFRPRHLHTC